MDLSQELAIIAALTFIFGILYALFIYIRPFPARMTWLSVAVGCGTTNLGVSAAVYAWLGLAPDVWPPPLPVIFLWGGYFLTGLPMIAFQVAKYISQEQIARAEKGLRDDSQTELA